MCTGKGCPLKDTCYRHTATPSEHWQSYFTNPPYDKKGKKCDMFWGEGSKQLMDTLIKIVNGQD